MRESTRKRYAEVAADLIAGYDTATEIGPFAAAFKALEMQAYLFAELSRPCLGDCHSSASPKTFCAARLLRQNTRTPIDHNYDPDHRFIGPVPLVVFDFTYYLYPAGNDGNQLKPFKQQGMPPYFRRNCFVVRNLNSAKATVVIKSLGTNLVLFGNSPPGAKATEFGDAPYEIALDKGESAVVVCNKSGQLVPDFPIYFTANVSNVLVFYVADPLP